MDPANRTVILHLVEALRACAAELRAADRLILDYGYGERAETTAALAQAEAVLAGPGSRADVLAAIHEFLHGSDDRRWRNDIDPLAAPTADAVPYWPPPCEHGSDHYAVLCVTCYRAQAADVAALRAALDTAHGRTRLNDCIERDQYRAERDRLAAENERLRADVARLDGNWRNALDGERQCEAELAAAIRERDEYAAHGARLAAILDEIAADVCDHAVDRPEDDQLPVIVRTLVATVENASDATGKAGIDEPLSLDEAVICLRAERDEALARAASAQAAALAEGVRAGKMLRWAAEQAADAYRAMTVSADGSDGWLLLRTLPDRIERGPAQPGDGAAEGEG